LPFFLELAGINFQQLTLCRVVGEKSFFVWLDPGDEHVMQKRT
jgi:hypothetical protein